MKIILIFISIMIIFSTAADAGFTGLVVNNTGFVQYKFFETDTIPFLQPNESAVLRPDIDSILKDAKYDVNTHVYTNPKKAPVPPSIPVTKEMPPLDPNVIVISGSGLGIAYLLLRRKQPPIPIPKLPE